MGAVWRWPELYERRKLTSQREAVPGRRESEPFPWCSSEDDKDAEDGYDEEEEHSNIILLTFSLKSMDAELRRPGGRERGVGPDDASKRVRGRMEMRQEKSKHSPIRRVKKKGSLSYRDIWSIFTAIY